jgi:hypothetical protein
MSLARLRLALSAALLLAACDDGEPPPEEPQPLFPADYAKTYTEVRACRQGGEHELNTIRVLADPAAKDPYLNRDAPFPTGAVVLKEEYDFSDMTCEGPILKWTVMARLEAGSSPKTLDWQWQEVDQDRNIVGDDTPKCYGCHTSCTPEVDGYEYTCTVP